MSEFYVTALSGEYSDAQTLASFNSRFAVKVTTLKEYYHTIFDLKYCCPHVKPQYRDEQRNKYVTLSDCGNACQENILTYSQLHSAFASQLVPEKIIFILREISYGSEQHYPKLVVWEHGKGMQLENSITIKNVPEKQPTNFSEHIVDGHHWLCFDMGLQTRIIDLNNFSNQFKLENIQKKLWIPKRNKIILVSNEKLTVFDLHLKKRTSQMSAISKVCAIAFDTSAKILFVADSQFIRAFYWEIAKCIGSVQHPMGNRSIISLHVAYDQVIILNGTTYMKMPMKCSAK
jgi:hypothetical protein